MKLLCSTYHSSRSKVKLDGDLPLIGNQPAIQSQNAHPLARQGMILWRYRQTLCLTKLYIGAIMSTRRPELKSIRKGIHRSLLLRLAGLACALLVSPTVRGQNVAWPQFRGPEANPVGAHARLAERWSKTENVEWMQQIPGRGWSSPI